MFICKVHRQHNSIVMTIPVNVCRELEIKKGDCVVLDKTQFGLGYRFTKLVLGDLRNAKAAKHSGRKNKGRRL